MVLSIELDREEDGRWIAEADSEDDPQGLKPPSFAGFAAWLKPCPDELHQTLH